MLFYWAGRGARMVARRVAKTKTKQQKYHEVNVRRGIVLFCELDLAFGGIDAEGFFEMLSENCCALAAAAPNVHHQIKA